MAKRILLVEGKDDQHAVYALLKRYQFPDDVFDTIAKDGITVLLESLSVQLKQSGLEVLGILVDADSDLNARWQSLRGILTQAGYSLPQMPDLGGTILREVDRPSIGIWLMPDNQLPGMLEDFAARLISPADPLWPRAQSVVDQIPQPERLFPVERTAKAKLHTWLAWQEEPGKPIGLAITTRYLDPNATQAAEFINWLQALFVNP